MFKRCGSPIVLTSGESEDECLGQRLSPKYRPTKNRTDDFIYDSDGEMVLQVVSCTFVTPRKKGRFSTYRGHSSIQYTKEQVGISQNQISPLKVGVDKRCHVSELSDNLTTTAVNCNFLGDSTSSGDQAEETLQRDEFQLPKRKVKKLTVSQRKHLCHLKNEFRRKERIVKKASRKNLSSSSMVSENRSICRRILKAQCEILEELMALVGVEGASESESDKDSFTNGLPTLDFTFIEHEDQILCEALTDLGGECLKREPVSSISPSVKEVLECLQKRGLNLNHDESLGGIAEELQEKLRESLHIHRFQSSVARIALAYGHPADDVLNEVNPILTEKLIENDFIADRLHRSQMDDLILRMQVSQNVVLEQIGGLTDESEDEEEDELMHHITDNILQMGTL